MNSLASGYCAVISYQLDDIDLFGNSKANGDDKQKFG